MGSRDRLVKILSLTLRGGTLGASFILALGATSASAAVGRGDAAPPSPEASVSGRLRAIRSGIEQIDNTQNASGSAELENQDASVMPTWWGNGGWGRWRFGWGNGGFGWPNGWHNGWHNGWPNWHNGWNNWGNGWHNYWHNY